MLLDIGSVGHLVGDEWVRQQAAAVLLSGLRPEQRRWERPLTVRGVGQCRRAVHAQLRAPSHLANFCRKARDWHFRQTFRVWKPITRSPWTECRQREQDDY